jgi:hypothetical protein
MRYGMRRRREELVYMASMRWIYGCMRTGE